MSNGTVVGGVIYEVAYDTRPLIEGQRQASKSLDQLDTDFTQVNKAAKVHVAGLALSGVAAREAARSTDALSNASVKAAAATERHSISSRRLMEALRGSKVALADVATSIATGEGLMRSAGAAASGLGAVVLAVGTALGSLALGFVKGRKETEEFNRSLTLTGNLSGMTEGQLNVLAGRLDSLAGITRGQAAEALNQLAQAGVRGGDGLGRVAEAAIRLEQAGGPAVAETVKAFQSLEREPVQAALKLNQATNFLTVELYRQIKALDEQGKHAEAARVAQEAFADSILERTPKITQNLGLLERAWRSVRDAAREGWDALLNVGRKETPEDKIEAMRARLALLQRQEASGGPKTIGGRATGSYGPEGAAQRRAEIEDLQRQLRAYEQAAGYARAAAQADSDRAAAVEAASDADKKAGANRKAKFDEAQYLRELQMRTADAEERVNLVEQEANARNDQLLKEGVLSSENYEKARVFIAEAAAQARVEVARREREQILATFEKDGRDMERQRGEKAKAGNFAEGIIAGGSQEDATVNQYRMRNDQLNELRAADLLSEQQYSAAIVANAQQTQQALAAIAQARSDAEVQAQMTTLAAVSGATDQLMGVLRAAGKEQSAIGKAAFLASKALAVAEIILNAEVGAAKAMGLGPYGIPLATYIRAAGYASAAMVGGLAIAQVAGGRQYGGPTTAGQLYRVNEAGKPEMFTAANGNQYMLPTANGNVTPANQVGSGATWTINIHNAPPGTTATVNESARIIEIAVARAEANFVDQVSNNMGPQWAALRNASNLQGRL
ncbi:phage tail length tape measure family protein [Piscinibacter defluvii]|uniref:phage tail length tape measure family protein n=1 Tax=Piscinibacter defluvii TaxID=1796922 RepID=UPI000FDEB8B3|nr:phage tail length tape measure family protein [Piscinibacter defluvii]